MQKILHKLYLIVGFLTTFLWLIIPKKFKKNSNSLIYYLLPDWYLMSYFFPIFALYSYFGASSFLALKTGLDYLNIGISGGNYFIITRDQEPAEFLMQLGVLVLIIICLYKQQKDKLE